MNSIHFPAKPGLACRVEQTEEKYNIKIKNIYVYCVASQIGPNNFLK